MLNANLTVSTRPRLIRTLLAVACLGSASMAYAQCLPPEGSQWWVNGKVNWPTDNGCVADTAIVQVLPGEMLIDRYGDPNGTYFAPTGTPIPNRALACDATTQRHTCYILRQPLAVEACQTAGYFGQPGGGTQYRAKQTASWLLAGGIIAQTACR